MRVHAPGYARCSNERRRGWDWGWNAAAQAAYAAAARCDPVARAHARSRKQMDLCVCDCAAELGEIGAKVLRRHFCADAADKDLGILLVC